MVKISPVKSKTRRIPYAAPRKTAKTPMNMVAMLSTVGIQDASSRPKPNSPRKSGNPTVTKRPFKVAIDAPKNTPRTPMYGFVLIVGANPSVCGCGVAMVI